MTVFRYFRIKIFIRIFFLQSKEISTTICWDDYACHYRSSNWLSNVQYPITNIELTSRLLSSMTITAPKTSPVGSVYIRKNRLKYDYDSRIRFISACSWTHCFLGQGRAVFFGKVSKEDMVWRVPPKRSYTPALHDQLRDGRQWLAFLFKSIE